MFLMQKGRFGMNDNIQKAIEVFMKGGIVIFPTDTAFGIGCRVDKQESIERLYSLRKRPVTQPMSLLVANSAMAKQYVTQIPEKVKKELLDRYWPGALTVILPANITTVPSLVRANGETIGVRMPDHDDLLHIITTLGVPVLGPSANFHGEKTPFHFTELDEALKKEVDFVLEGVCKKTEASTVIDCVSTPWKIVRQGAISI